jgi:hypothetical protein
VPTSSAGGLAAAAVRLARRFRHWSDWRQRRFIGKSAVGTVRRDPRVRRRGIDSDGPRGSPPCSDGPRCLACCELNSPSGLQRYQETMGDCACSFCSGPCALAPTCGPFNPNAGVHPVHPFLTVHHRMRECRVGLQCQRGLQNVFELQLAVCDLCSLIRRRFDFIMRRRIALPKDGDES